LDLLDEGGIGAASIRSIGAPVAERVEALALRLGERVLVHPAAVPLMVGAPMEGRNALTLNEQLLDLLCDGVGAASTAGRHRSQCLSHPGNGQSPSRPPTGGLQG
jgi:hypothetical protein